MPFVYHLCSADFRGTTLYPLHQLRRELPDVYERERKKYQGRESVPAYRLPHLDVAWGDTVNLSALSPRRLVDLRRRLGIPFSQHANHEPALGFVFIRHVLAAGAVDLTGLEFQPL